MLSSILQYRFVRAAACVVGCTLALLAFGATRSSLGLMDAGVPWLALSTAVWLAWVATDFSLSALAPRKPAAEPKGVQAAGDLLEFADTEAMWRHN